MYLVPIVKQGPGPDVANFLMLLKYAIPLSDYGFEATGANFYYEIRSVRQNASFQSNNTTIL